MFFMFATAISIITSTFILKLHYRGFDREPPKWVRIIAFDIMAPIMCLRSLTNWSKKHRQKGKCLNNGETRNLTEIAEEPNGDCRVMTDIEFRAHRTNSNAEHKDSNYHVDEYTGHTKQQLKEFHDEWKALAEVIDRFFFWIFLLFIIIPSISMLGLVQYFKTTPSIKNGK